MKTILTCFVFCTIMQAQNGAPSVAMSSPGGNGSGSSIHFHVTAADPNGVNDIGWLGIGVGMGWQYPGGCFILVYPNADKNYVVLLNDASTVWNGPFGIGGPWVAENSQCSINMSTFSRTVSTQSNGSLTADFDVNFKSSFVGQRYIYTIASDLAGWYGGGNPTAGWYVTVGGGGNQVKPGGRSTFELDTTTTRTATNIATGQPMTAPTTSHPLPIINLSTASVDNPWQVSYSTPITATLRYGTPNTQVWGSYESIEPFAHYPDGSIQAYFWGKPNATADTQQNFTGLDFKGGWLLGYTDSTGYFVQTYLPFSLYGDNVIHLYVGNLSGTYTTNIPEENYMGALAFWVYNGAGQPTPPNFYSARKGSRVMSKGKLDTFKVHPASSTWEKIAGNWEYTFSLDTSDKNIEIVRVGRMSDYAGEPGPLNPNFSRQNNWDGNGDGWTYGSTAGVRAPGTKFKLTSDWLPGPVSIYFASADNEGYERQETERDELLAAKAHSIFNTGVRKHAIGPAIPPDATERDMLGLIRNWVDEGNHFLIPLTAEGVNLKEALGAIKGLKDGYETDVIDCIRAALEGTTK